MKLIKCDRHPDRDAVATFKVFKYPPGARPFLLSGTALGFTYMIDLCQECAAQVEVIRDKDA